MLLIEKKHEVSCFLLLRVVELLSLPRIITNYPAMNVSNIPNSSRISISSRLDSQLAIISK